MPSMNDFYIPESHSDSPTENITNGTMNSLVFLVIILRGVIKNIHAICFLYITPRVFQFVFIIVINRKLSKNLENLRSRVVKAQLCW